MLEKTFEIHPEVYEYSQSAYSKPSFRFYGDSVIKSCDGAQQGRRSIISDRGKKCDTQHRSCNRLRSHTPGALDAGTKRSGATRHYWSSRWIRRKPT